MAKPDNMAAVAFLRQWSAHGPWVLTAIDVDKKGIATDTFDSDNEVGLLAWLEEYSGVRNCYFHVNPTMKPLTKKANREDVKALAWLHVDIDPRAGEDLEEERKKALAQLQSPPEGVPLPTCIIFSGGGYQGFWKLEEPFQIDGDLEKAEEAKRWNMQLEVLFHGDHCHNIDRIMRLPGTVNIPDAKKKRKGRKPELAKVVEFVSERVYSLSMFTPAPAVQDAGAEAFSAGTVFLKTGNVDRLASIDELDKYANCEIPEWCKVLIVQGEIPDEPNKYDSRSEKLFAVCCELVRCGVSPEWIYSVITDKEFRISESVLDKGHRAEQYALRQINQASEHAIHPMLRKMNSRHAVVGNLGGRCRVIEEVHDYALNRSKLTIQSFEDIRNRYMQTRVQIGENKNGETVYKQLGKWWLEHENRRQYHTIVFAPRKEVKGSYNLWKGFSCEAAPGDCSLFLQHVHENICSGDRVLYEYVIGWMARTVQHPDEPGASAIVMRGKQGTGKSFFAKAFGRLWGRHFLQVSNPKHLVGNFNAHLHDCIVLFGDEAFAAGRKEHEGVLKTLITEDSLAIEKKGVDVEVSPNYLHVILASNSNWVVPANVDERRFFVLDVAPTQMQNAAYFGKIQKQLDTGGYEALLFMLMHYDLKNFDAYRIPKTKALQEQKQLSFTSPEEWWFSKLNSGQILPRAEGWDIEIRRDFLIEDYFKYSQKIGSQDRSTTTTLGIFLKRACPKGWPKSTRRLVHDRDEHGDPEQKRAWFWRFPTLEECRKHWDDNFGGPYDWEADATMDHDEGAPF